MAEGCFNFLSTLILSPEKSSSPNNSPVPTSRSHDGLEIVVNPNSCLRQIYYDEGEGRNILSFAMNDGPDDGNHLTTHTAVAYSLLWHLYSYCRQYTAAA